MNSCNNNNNTWQWWVSTEVTYRCIYSPSWLAWSEGRQPHAAESGIHLMKSCNDYAMMTAHKTMAHVSTMCYAELCLTIAGR